MSVRGEYDDNVNTAPDGQEDEAWILNLSPSVLYKYEMENTSFEAGYTFGFKQFFGRAGEDKEDFSHTVQGSINHRFSPRFTLSVQERFSFDQEDALQDRGIQRRVGGDRIRNTAGLSASYDWTERFNTLTQYNNVFLHYFDKPSSTTNNYISHEVSQQFRFNATSKTTPFFNYVYRTFDYRTIQRDRDEHLALVGADHYLLDNWLISGKAGAQFVFYDNPIFNDNIGPYANVRTVWNYDKKSNLGAGYTFGTSVTDNANFSSSENHSFDAQITHYFTEKFSVGASGLYELASFESDQSFTAGARDITEHTISAGINARYAFTEYLSVDAGYRYSEVISDTNAREYDRNRVYLGVTGSY
ncbi:MAG: outer membrane beta-barrel protein [Candidatus Methylacidiphilales bacterium]